MRYVILLIMLSSTAFSQFHNSSGAWVGKFIDQSVLLDLSQNGHILSGALYMDEIVVAISGYYIPSDSAMVISGMMDNRLRIIYSLKKTSDSTLTGTWISTNSTSKEKAVFRRSHL